MKKLVLLVALFTALTTQSVHSCCEEMDIGFTDGFYGSVSLGASWFNNDWTGISSIGLVDDYSSSGSKNIFDTSTPRGSNRDNGRFIGAINLGYQVVDCRLYLGAQIGGTFRAKRNAHRDDFRTYSQVLAADGSTLSGSATTQTHLSISSCEFDADLKPGVLICPNFLIYALGGVAVTEFKLDTFGRWTEMGSEIASVELVATSSYHRNKTLAGFRAGAGMEYLFNNCLGVSLEYVFTDYSKMRAYNVAKNASIATWNLVYGIHAPEVKVTTHSLKGGIVYHF